MKAFNHYNNKLLRHYPMWYYDVDFTSENIERQKAGM